MAARPGTPTEAPITPLRLPRGVKTVVLFGGTFDPPTSFHTGIKWHLSSMGLSEREAAVVYVPTPQNPLKKSSPVADDWTRVAMLFDATACHWDGDKTSAGPPWALLWTDEIRRRRWMIEQGQPAEIYTIDTVRRLRAAVGEGVRIHLLIGTDQALQFEKWRAWKELLREAEPLVVLRPPCTTVRAFLEALKEQGASASQQLAWARRVVALEPDDTSATRVRALLARQSSDVRTWPVELKLTLDEVVARLVARLGLYGVRRKRRKRAK